MEKKMKSTILLLLIISTSAFAAIETVFVDDNAPNDPAPGDPTVSDPAEDGTFAHPYDAIQEAIDKVMYIGEKTGNVMVLPGHYTGPGNRDVLAARIILRSVNLSNPTDPNAPIDPNAIPITTIDAQGTEAEPHRCLIAYPKAQVMGFTVTNGYAETGGGIFCGGNPVISNCIITNNTATDQNLITGGGGGISCKGGSAKIINCTITNNTLGGIACYQGAPVIENCTIADNTSFGGAGIISYESAPRITNCTITANSASAWGGGVVISQQALQGTAVLSNCLITNNRSVSGSAGVSLSQDMTMENCIVTGNHTNLDGGGIGCGYSAVVIKNCTVIGNRADGGCGGITCGDFGNLTVTNSIVRNNSASFANQIGYSYPPYGDPKPHNLYVSYSNIQGGKEAIEGWGYTTWQDGNTDTNPQFANPGHWDNDTWQNGDYHLKSKAGRFQKRCQTPFLTEWIIDDTNSPCIDAGDPAGDYANEPAYNGDRINMGAYGGTEYASKTANCPQPPVGDLDNDCKVTFADFALLAAHWMQCNLDPPTACR